MAFWNNSKNNEAASTQQYLEFAEIHDGVIITKTGELRAILMVSSINFALKSEQEQNAIVYAYQNFLNSLTFPIQIAMQSKKLDLSKYLNKLKSLSKQQTNELLRMQTSDYANFVERLITMANIMDKKFFVVVPFMPPPKVGVSPNILGNKDPNAPAVQMNFDEFKKYKVELDQRLQVISAGLGGVGMRSVLLNTQQIIELFYNIYNPEEGAKQKLTEVENLTSELVESELEQAPPAKGGASE